MEHEKITVIMPVYNPDRYLRPCLDSLINQTFQGFHLIAIDDASTDGSYEVLEEYAKKDDRVTILKNPYNIGAARTRNIGLQLAKGEYVAILDSDDFYEPDYLEVMYEKAKETDSDIVVANVVYKYKEGDVIRKPPSFLLEKIKDVFSVKDLPDHIFNTFPMGPTIKLYRRSFLEEDGILFQNLSNCNDVYFGCANIVSAKRIVYINRVMVHYRVHWEGNISAKRGKNPLCIYDALVRVRRFLMEKNIFSICQRAFNSYAINNIVFNLLSADDSTQKSAVAFWQSEGLKKLGMWDLAAGDFFSEVYFGRWKSLASRGEASLTVAGLPLENSYSRFFEWMRAESHENVALWGYGDIGRSFLNMAEKYDFPISEIYDQRAQNLKTQSGVPIRRFSDRRVNPRLVIVTPNGFTEEIAKEIWSHDENIRVIDFSAYLLYGATIEESLVRRKDV